MTYIKYPHTEHLPGSKITPDKDFQGLSLFAPENTHFVIEEKMDGIGLGICFIEEEIHIQQRGHIFPLNEMPYFLHNFKLWLLAHEELLYFIVDNRYVLFGEWMEFKHTVFYNNLPSYFLEYDIYDRINDLFLSTSERHHLIDGQLESVRVMSVSHNLQIMGNLLQNTQSYANNCDWTRDYDIIMKRYPHTHILPHAGYEGFYIKLEDQEKVVSRYKWIRKDFFDIVAENDMWKTDIRNILAYSTTY